MGAGLLGRVQDYFSAYEAKDRTCLIILVPCTPFLCQRNKPLTINILPKIKPPHFGKGMPKWGG
jgi:hypothetical protein